MNALTIKSNAQKRMAAVLAVGIAIAGGTAFACDGDNALQMTGDGVQAVGEGAVTVIATPVAVTEDLAKGDLIEATAHTVAMPVAGVGSAVAGTVQAVSGVGKGLADITAKGFGWMGKAAGSVHQTIGEELPTAQVMINK